ncbi:hypothetical protein [Vibrio parahaemolyticus]|uniref:hypothetical protein n=1 Tax=Vibrio parahaemolyticus TaxID=670 RepID=UPI001121F05A|nr:hypothetical protein [Vibrio parahaemolyticus]TOH95403.1 hypothetical protein CGI70_20930 [Vibrio parahaemolyticus]
MLAENLNNFTNESSEYLDTSRHYGYFSFLLLKPGRALHEQNERFQFAHSLQSLPDLLPQYMDKAKAERKNLFISQATFRKLNRRRSSFLSVSTLFVDLDIYTSLFCRCQSKEQICDLVEEICELNCIPKPSVIIDSGGGMYLKWFIERDVFKHGLSYWEAIQSKLNELFSSLGADRNAIDVSRVLRVVDSTNYKYKDEPVCKIMRVDYALLSNTSIKRHSLTDFSTLLPFSLEDAQAFNERMTAVNNQYASNKRKITKEKHNRLLILECLKELDSGNHLDGMTPAKLNDYIKSTRQLKRFSLKDCTTYLDKFLKQKERYEKYATGHTGNVINSKSKFNLVRRNWGLYQDILNLAEYRYSDHGVEDGMRDAFMFAACSQYTLSAWQKNTEETIHSTYKNIGKILVPHWTDAKINNCLTTLKKRLAKTKGGEFDLYRFSDNYLKNLLDVKDTELQLLDSRGEPLIKEMLGETERDRRDPERHDKAANARKESMKKLRKARSTLSRSDYEAQSQDKAKQAQSLKAQGFKNAQIAFELGIHVKSVSRYLR